MDKTIRQQLTGFLETPQIWTGVPSFPYSSYFIDKRKVNHFPGSIHLPGTMVLGKRMEEFFKYFITYFTKDKVLAHSTQIIDQKKTLGELDFLIENQQNGHISHVELIYKFYLYDPDLSSETDRWTGPNHRDSLIRKKEHLLNKQFPLLYRTETQKTLNNMGVSAEWMDQKICFKANFFIPWSFSKEHPDLGGYPIQGHWIRWEEFVGEYFEGAKFYSPRKPDWPILPWQNEHWVSYEAILQKIRPMIKNDRSPLIWMRTSENEFKRFFIVWW